MTRYSRFASRSRASPFIDSVGWGPLVIVAILLLVVAIPACNAFYSEHSVTTVVTDKERVCDRDFDGRTDCKYLVFTDDGTFKVTDSIRAGRLTSSDAYGRIKRCHEYRLTYYGIRFGLTSSYPNILKAEDLGRAEGCEP